MSQFAQLDLDGLPAVGPELGAAGDAPATAQNPSSSRALRQVRLTREEVWDRIEFIQKLLARQIPRGHIVKAVQQKFKSAADGTQHTLTARQIGVYIDRAKEQLLRDTNKSAAEWRAELANITNGVIGDPEADPRVRLQGVEVLMRLFGLDQLPPQVVIQNNAGRTIPVVEIEIRDRADLDELLSNQQIAQLAYDGKLPGVPREHAAAALRRLRRSGGSGLVDAAMAGSPSSDDPADVIDAVASPASGSPPAWTAAVSDRKWYYEEDEDAEVKE